MEEEFAACEEKVRKKCYGTTTNKKKVANLGTKIDWNKLSKAYREIDERGGKGLTEEQVKELGATLKPLIVAPIDKDPAELAVL